MQIKPKSFEFVSYTHKNETFKFKYKINFENQKPLQFEEVITLPQKPKNKIPTHLLESIHLMLGISYYKLYYAPTFISPYKLNKEQTNFWNTAYLKGLGEFIYINKLDPKKIAKFKTTKTKEQEVPHFNLNETPLVGIGGGKDSIVSAELLDDFKSFVIETTVKNDPNIKKVLKQIGKPVVKIDRQLDPKIFKNHPESLNGHIPISAVFSILGLLSCIALDHKYFIVSNEHSSNYGNTNYKGLTVNHQWSKSEEYELALRKYFEKFIATGPRYFSLLRPLQEIRIVELFSDYPKYFELFSSCNKKNKKWCGQCAKCCFVFALMSAYTPKKVVKIFNKNLYEDKSLIPLFKQICGLEKIKPLDCVGTFEESQTAIKMASPHFKNTVVIKELQSKVKIHQEVFKTYPSKNIPHQFRFLGLKSAYILGYGKEGQATEKWLKKHYPKLKVEIGDQSISKNYLKNQQNFDIVIKTPGIQKEKITSHYTTATNQFMSRIKNLTIGVTGSKGKSTTVSLIHHILKTARKKSHLLGNIGKPMLSEIDKIKPNDIVVLELSSYQLDDIEYSPDIAVILNLKDAHNEYHGSRKAYHQAKKNIFKFNPSHKIKQKDFKDIKVKTTGQLIGNHNKENIKAAIKVAQILKIPSKTINKAIETFKPIPHRLEFVGEYKNIKFYNDSISTTPESAIAAIKALKPNTIFLGGQYRGETFTQLEKEIHKSNVQNVVLFPDAGEKIIKNPKNLNILHTKSMKKAVQFAFKHTTGICLLSGACASYSLWKNFEEKGEEFKHFIKNL